MSGDLGEVRGTAAAVRVAPTGPAAAGERGAALDPAAFQRLLESLHALARDQQSAPPVQQTVHDAAQLQDAMRAADDRFVTAMDLRQKLEAAFRGLGPRGPGS